MYYLELLNLLRSIDQNLLYQFIIHWKIFDIPFYLMDELEHYDFNIRLYSGALMDTVLYAIPKKYKAK